MKRTTAVVLVAALATFAVGTRAAQAAGKGKGGDFEDPFHLIQCYGSSHYTAAEFGEAVCVTYDSINVIDIASKKGEVSWTLTQTGTAHVVGVSGADYGTYSFDVKEKVVDQGDDAGCGDGSGRYWLGYCFDHGDWTKLESFDYQWNVDHGKIIHLHWTWDSRRGTTRYENLARGG